MYKAKTPKCFSLVEILVHISLKILLKRKVSKDFCKRLFQTKKSLLRLLPLKVFWDFLEYKSKIAYEKDLK